MTQLILQIQSIPSSAACGLCGHLLTVAPGAVLALADRHAPVCTSCGQKHAPALAALLDLADTAERVSRIGRHSVFPPLTALLDLASAAEKFCSFVPPGPASAAG